jgi:hypothetical protein
VNARLRPTADFARVDLDLTIVAAGARFGRIYFDRHTNPLGFGNTPSRFSDPRRRKAENRFGVLYLGETLKVCFLEAVLRDKRNGAIGDYPLDETELRARRFAAVEVVAPLAMVDLRGDGGVRIGVPSDVTRASGHRLARAWSAAFHTSRTTRRDCLPIKTERADQSRGLRSRHPQASRRRHDAIDGRPRTA